MSINDAEAFDHPEGMTVTKKKVRIGAIVSNYRSGDRYTVWTYSALPIVAITVHQAADALIPNLPYSDLNLNVQDGVQITQEIDDDIMSGLENAAINVIEPRIYSKFRDDLENTQTYQQLPDGSGQGKQAKGRHAEDGRRLKEHIDRILHLSANRNDGHRRGNRLRSLSARVSAAHGDIAFDEFNRAQRNNGAFRRAAVVAGGNILRGFVCRLQRQSVFQGQQADEIQHS